MKKILYSSNAHPRITSRIHRQFFEQTLRNQFLVNRRHHSEPQIRSESQLRRRNFLKKSFKHQIRYIIHPYAQSIKKNKKEEQRSEESAKVLGSVIFIQSFHKNHQIPKNLQYKAKGNPLKVKKTNKNFHSTLEQISSQPNQMLTQPQQAEYNLSPHLPVIARTRYKDLYRQKYNNNINKLKKMKDSQTFRRGWWNKPDEQQIGFSQYLMRQRP